MSITHTTNIYVYETVLKKSYEAINNHPDVIACKLMQEKLDKELGALLDEANDKARKLFKALGYTRNKDVFVNSYNSAVLRKDNPVVKMAEKVKKKFQEQAYNQYRQIILDLDFMDNYTKEDVEKMVDNVKFEI